MRQVDEKATKLARARQREAIKRLNEVFGFTPLHAKLYLMRRMERMVWRTRPGVPPSRDPRRKKIRRLRKIAKASRRRNR